MKKVDGMYLKAEVYGMIYIIFYGTAVKKVPAYRH